MARRAALAVWAFVVGEDWRTAVAVVVLLAATALLAAANLPAWWLSPPGTLITLQVSLRRAIPRREAVCSSRI
jgi:hypothetical protein